MSWDTPFAEPVPLPSGQLLHTLRDAGTYITGLPKTQYDTTAWQTAMQCLIQAADHNGPVAFARLGMMQALHPKPEPAYRPSSSEPKWRNNYKLVRDR
jgi:hypothetical protein